MAETTEERTARLEGLIEQMDKRLSNMEGELVRIHTRIDQVNNRIDQVNNKIDQRFNWLMGIMITMWVTLIIAIIFKG